MGDDDDQPAQNVWRPSAVEVGYYAETARPMLGLVRAIGALSLVFGIVGLVMVPVGMMYQRAARPANAPAKSDWYVFHERLWPCATVVLACCLIVAGGACLRRRPRGLGLLVVWAWAMVGWVVYGMAVNSWYLLDESAGRYSAVTIYYLGYYAQHWLSSVVLPVVVLVLSRHQAVRAVFEDGAS